MRFCGFQKARTALAEDPTAGALPAMQSAPGASSSTYLVAVNGTTVAVTPSPSIGSECKACDGAHKAHTCVRQTDQKTTTKKRGPVPLAARPNGGKRPKASTVDERDDPWGGGASGGITFSARRISSLKSKASDRDASENG